MKTRLFIPQKKLGTAVFLLEEFKRESKGVMLDEDCGVSHPGDRSLSSASSQ